MACKFIWCSCRNKTNLSTTNFACLGIFITQLRKYYKGDRFAGKFLQPFLYEAGWCKNTTMRLCCDIGEMKRAQSIDSHPSGQPNKFHGALRSASGDRTTEFLLNRPHPNASRGF